MLLKPIKGEEWIEKFRRKEFWIGIRRKYPQKLYARLTKSYIGWWLYLRLHYPPFRYFFLNRLCLLIDPLSCGGLYSHIRCFCFNFFVCDIWWRGKRKIWELFHPKEHNRRQLFWRACMQATDEGYADKMNTVPPFDDENFHGYILGKRYFNRVAEIMEEFKPFWEYNK